MTKRVDLSVHQGANKQRAIDTLLSSRGCSNASDLKTAELIKRVNDLYAAQKYRGAPLKHWMAKQLRLVLDGKMLGYDHLKRPRVGESHMKKMQDNLAPIHADYVEAQRKRSLMGTATAAGERSGEVRKDRGAEEARCYLATHPQGKTARQLAKMVVAEQLFSAPQEKRRKLAAITRLLKRHGVLT